MGIPTFPYPDTAARMFNYMWRYNYNLRTLYETPVRTCLIGQHDEPRPGGPDHAERTQRQPHHPDRVRIEAATGSYGIPIVETRVAHSEHKAVRFAQDIGYPVVLKLYSRTITHKTDVGGVQLNLSR